MCIWAAPRAKEELEAFIERFVSVPLVSRYYSYANRRPFTARFGHIFIIGARAAARYVLVRAPSSPVSGGHVGANGGFAAHNDRC